MAARPSVRISRNFERNLDSIREFLDDADLPEVFGGLLDRLFDEVIPLLEQHPEIGIDFLERQPASAELRLQWDSLRKRVEAADASLREYIAGPYLMLYAVRAREITLLSIKHHRQLSFDLAEIWGTRR